MGFWLCGIGGLWRSWKKLWVNFWCLEDLGMWETTLNGLNLCVWS